MTSSPCLIVVYDRGAATVGEIAAALPQLASVVFVTREASEHTRPLLPLLQDIGDVVTFRESPAEAVGRLTSARPDGIVTYSESMLPVTAELAAELGLPFHSRDTVRLLTDKYAQRRRLHATGTDSVASRLITSPEEWPGALRAVGLPAIVKPVRGEGSRSTYRVDDSGGGFRLVSRLLAAEPGLVMEEFLQGRPCHPYGDYVSVESAVSKGAVSHLAVTGKFPLIPPFRETGQFWPAPLPDEELRRVQDLTGEAIRALGITTGITHTEIKLTNAGPRLIEVNGRLGGNINDLSVRAVRRDLVELAGRLALGEAVDAPPVTLNRVVFQYSNLAPSRPCRLDSLSGQRRLRNAPGITGYRTWIRPGTPIDGGVSTHDLDLIRGEAADHAEMIALLETALSHLTFGFTLPDGSMDFCTPALGTLHGKEAGRVSPTASPDPTRSTIR
ncbi:hypothetical protein GCM10010211_10550 [Streptomyces albospinus]|uniref:ATP-grasp domain-containing protein n=1 Tax=Streptomyces albospinus TaxID=285515 RepID=A0ABQ2USL6_9ACTN|nr:ATP-grasp domain-containing protein [Streptomyces albospinus]GGU48241.1 hypothetical protein GCM10010211_10550 [Streptomyces albospinus]